MHCIAMYNKITKTSPVRSKTDMDLYLCIYKYNYKIVSVIIIWTIVIHFVKGPSWYFSFTYHISKYSQLSTYSVDKIRSNVILNDNKCYIFLNMIQYTYKIYCYTENKNNRKA